MKAYFAIHVARILCKYMPYCTEEFSDVIPEHLKHATVVLEINAWY